jgi:K(+)-stimulated pyrophosphate-energized sodium pump
MKLILFALMARGVGIVASIVGIFFVRGSDSEDVDPLKPIRSGFWFSAAVAAIGTLALAMFMMKGVTATYYVDGDGKSVSGLTKIDWDDIRTAAIVSVANQQEISKQQVGTQPGQPPKEVKLDQSEKAVTDRANAFLREISGQRREQWEAQKKSVEDQIAQAKKDNQPAPALTVPPEPKPVADLTAGQIAKALKNPIADYTVIMQSQPSQPLTLSLVQGALDENLNVSAPYLVKTESPDPMNPAGEKQVTWAPMNQALMDQQKLEPLAKLGISIAVDSHGDLFYVLDREPGDDQAVLSMPQMGYSKSKIDPMAGAQKRVKADGDSSVVVAKSKPVEWWRFFVAVFFGIIMAFLIELLTDYFVSFEKKPVREVAAASSAGPAPMIIQGVAYGMESSVWAVFAIIISLMAPLFIFPPAEFGGFILSFYGIALVGLGLLTTTGYILAMDTFGPISDNAQGVYEMSHASKDEQVERGKMSGSRAVQRLDAAGNTTKALTKGFAIATAVVAAVALFHAYLDSAKLEQAGLRLEIPQIFIGLLVGGAAPFLFSAFSINAVGRAAFQLIGEVRRQFAADPGIMAGTSKPNYGKCVEIVTSAAQKELLGPGILAIALPALVGFGMSIGAEPTIIAGKAYNLVGAQALGGFLAGAILSGQLLAVMLANSGGLWDNAKKTIEDGLYGGKGSEAHKAGVVCDTVGDPFKDTAGPALNPLIKVMNLVALLLAGVVIMPLSVGVLSTIVVVCVILLGIAVYWSKRGSIGSELAKSSGAGTS